MYNRSQENIVILFHHEAYGIGKSTYMRREGCRLYLSVMRVFYLFCASTVADAEWHTLVGTTELIWTKLTIRFKRKSVINYTRMTYLRWIVFFIVGFVLKLIAENESPAHRIMFSQNSLNIIIGIWGPAWKKLFDQNGNVFIFLKTVFAQVAITLRIIIAITLSCIIQKQFKHQRNKHHYLESFHGRALFGI